MIQALLHLLGNLLVVVGLNRSIEPYTAHLSPASRLQYAYYIVDAADQTKLDPYLVAAVMWHESDFQNVPRNGTNDYGLMQVHWQPGENWLAGMVPEDLMDPRTNILAGARELTHLRAFCRARDHAGDHHWLGHYKYGLVVLSSRYGDAVLGRRDRLIRNRFRPSS